MIDEIYMIWAAGKPPPTRMYKTLSEVEEGLAYLKRARDEYKLAGYATSAPEIWENISKRIEQAR